MRPDAPAAQLVVSVHDAAPTTVGQLCRWLAELDARDVPASVLVIPGTWRAAGLSGAPGFAALLRARRERGDAIVQHGWSHAIGADACGWRTVTERVIARGAGEFAALSAGAATLRLRAGRQVLAAAGLPTDAFTAPGWLHSPGTLTALRKLGYRYTTDHAGVLDLAHGTRIPGPALSHRAAGSGERIAARLVERLAPALARRGGLVRIALHPDDLERPGLAAATLRAIDRCLELGAVPTTYDGLVAADPAGHALLPAS